MKPLLQEEEREEEEDNWLNGKRGGREEQGFWWKGTTEFEVLLNEEKKDTTSQKIEVWATEKPGGGNLSVEVNLAKESPEDQEEWKISDASEFKKIQESKAIQVLDVESSRKVEEELRKEGALDRILPSRMARKYKPAEQPGEAPSKKSRLCTRGAGQIQPNSEHHESERDALNSRLDPCIFKYYNNETGRRASNRSRRHPGMRKRRVPRKDEDLERKVHLRQMGELKPRRKGSIFQ